MPTEFEREIVFWTYAVLGVLSVVLVVVMIYTLRAEYLIKKRVREIMVVGNRVRLVQPLKLELGTLGAGMLGEIKAIYERPASLNHKRVYRRIAFIEFPGFPVAMSPNDMKYHFVPSLAFRWRLPKEERTPVTG